MSQTPHLVSVRVDSLSGPALNWATQEAKIQEAISSGDELPIEDIDYHQYLKGPAHNFTEDYSSSALLAARRIASIPNNFPYFKTDYPWVSHRTVNHVEILSDGGTMLEAGLRCFIKSVVGQTINIPEQLVLN